MHKKLLTHLVGAFTAAALVSSTQAATAIFDDFSTNTLSSYVTPTSRETFTYTNLQAGLHGDLGRLNTTSSSTNGFDGNNAAVHSTAIGTFDADLSFTASIFLHTGAISTSATGGLNIAGIGFADTPANLFANTGDKAGTLHVDLRRAHNGASTQFGFRVRADDSGTGQSLSDGAVTLVGNTWYQLTLTATQTAENQFSLSMDLRNWGVDGVTGGAIVLSHTASMTNLSIGGTEAIYAGFLARNSPGSDTNINYVDNFRAIPEPAGGALALIGCALLGGMRRRRS